MGEYITKEKAVEIIEQRQKELCPVGKYGRNYVYGSDREKYDAWEEIIDEIENMEAADVAEVVRCKDCVWRGREECAMFYCCDCGEQHTWETDNDFCSYGARMEKEAKQDAN